MATCEFFKALHSEKREFYETKGNLPKYCLHHNNFLIFLREIGRDFQYAKLIARYVTSWRPETGDRKQEEKKKNWGIEDGFIFPFQCNLGGFLEI